MDASMKQTNLLPASEGTDWSTSRFDRRRHLNNTLEETIEEIHCLPGFERFLLPQSVDQMMAAANRGPLVVLNANRYHCDAFIIKQNHIDVINLPHLHLEDVSKMAQMMRTDMTPVLESLWNVMAQPVLEYLGFDQPPSGDDWLHVNGFLLEFLEDFLFMQLGIISTAQMSQCSIELSCHTVHLSRHCAMVSDAKSKTQ